MAAAGPGAASPALSGASGLLARLLPAAGAWAAAAGRGLRPLAAEVSEIGTVQV